jgi:hypothetical protein
VSKETNLLPVTSLDVKVFFYRVCGPFAVLMSYLSELHGLKYRSRIMMSTGIFFSIASIILPSLAWAIIPHPQFNFKIVENYFGEQFQFGFADIFPITSHFRDAHMADILARMRPAELDERHSRFVSPRKSKIPHVERSERGGDGSFQKNSSTEYGSGG